MVLRRRKRCRAVMVHDAILVAAVVVAVKLAHKDRHRLPRSAEAASRAALIDRLCEHQVWKRAHERHANTREHQEQRRTRFLYQQMLSMTPNFVCCTTAATT